MKLFIFILLIIVQPLTAYGMEGTSSNAREDWRRYQRTILSHINNEHREPLRKQLTTTLEADTSSYTSPVSVDVAFSIKKAAQLTLKNTPSDAQLKVLFVDLDQTLFFEGITRFWKTRPTNCNQQTGLNFEEVSKKGHRIFKTPYIDESTLISFSRICGTSAIDQFINVPCHETRETMEEDIQKELETLHQSGYHVIGLTNRSDSLISQVYTQHCLQDAGIAFNQLNNFKKNGIIFQADNDGFTFNNGVVYCGKRNKDRQAFFIFSPKSTLR